MTIDANDELIVTAPYRGSCGGCRDLAVERNRRAMQHPTVCKVPVGQCELKDVPNVWLPMSH
jgi:hypothetical protein